MTKARTLAMPAIQLISLPVFRSRSSLGGPKLGEFGPEVGGTAHRPHRWRHGGSAKRPRRHSAHPLITSACPTPLPSPAPAEVYAALWLGALLVASGELPDPLPPPIEDLARVYVERFPPDVKA